MLLPNDPARCYVFGHVFKMDDLTRYRKCARCGAAEIDLAIEYLSTLRQHKAIDVSEIKPGRKPYLWGAGHQEPTALPVSSRIEKIEDNVITVRFGGKV